jgi:hypothetical protein
VKRVRPSTLTRQRCFSSRSMLTTWERTRHIEKTGMTRDLAEE